MITLKSAHEIELMRRAGKITAAARAVARDMVKPGVTTQQIDKAVYKFITEQGATPSFLHYNGYPASVCVSVNDEIIHGIPGKRVLQEGDIVRSMPWTPPRIFRRRSALGRCCSMFLPRRRTRPMCWRFWNPWGTGANKKAGNIPLQTYKS